MPAPLEHVHVEQGRVGHLQEADPVAGHPVQRGAVVTPGQQVEGVDGERDRRVVGTSYDVPGVADAVQVPAPGERLEGDRDAVPGRELADPVQLLGGEVAVVEGVGADVRAGEERRHPELAHHLELGPDPVQHRVEPFRGHRLEVADRLEQVDGQPQVGAAARDLARAQRAGDQVVVEELDAVEARRGDRGELVGEQRR